MILNLNKTNKNLCDYLKNLENHYFIEVFGVNKTDLENASLIMLKYYELVGNSNFNSTLNKIT